MLLAYLSLPSGLCEWVVSHARLIILFRGLLQLEDIFSHSLSFFFLFDLELDIHWCVIQFFEQDSKNLERINHWPSFCPMTIRNPFKWLNFSEMLSTWYSIAEHGNNVSHGPWDLIHLLNFASSFSQLLTRIILLLSKDLIVSVEQALIFFCSWFISLTIEALRLYVVSYLTELHHFYNWVRFHYMC